MKTDTKKNLAEQIIESLLEGTTSGIRPLEEVASTGEDNPSSQGDDGIVFFEVDASSESMHKDVPSQVLDVPSAETLAEAGDKQEGSINNYLEYSEASINKFLEYPEKSVSTKKPEDSYSDGAVEFSVVEPGSSANQESAEVEEVDIVESDDVVIQEAGAVPRTKLKPALNPFFEAAFNPNNDPVQEYESDSAEESVVPIELNSPSAMADRNEENGDKTRQIDTNSVEISGNESVTFNSEDATHIAGAGGHSPHGKEQGKLHTQVGIGYNPVLNADSGNRWTSMESALVQSENLRIAQRRIIDLEKEIERLRGENEELTGAGETLKKLSEELKDKVEKSDIKLKDNKEIYTTEIGILKDNLIYKDKENNELRFKVEELEMRLSGDLKKIRVRERELENRLELVRMESSTLIRSKDENILELKRQIDQLTTETENYQRKCQELYKQMESNQDRFRRTVKALRLALSNLETNEGGVVPFKKAE